MRAVIAGLVLSVGVSIVAAQDGTTEAKLVKYDRLGEIIHENKGRVVVVDLWTTACNPCIAKFPKLVELQNKYGPDGLTIITVNIDPFVSDPDEREGTVKAIQALLGGKNFNKAPVTLTNLILDEKPALVEEKFHFDGQVPCMFLFTREGKWWQFRFDEPEKDFARLIELVHEELKTKK